MISEGVGNVGQARHLSDETDLLEVGCIQSANCVGSAATLSEYGDIRNAAHNVYYVKTVVMIKALSR